MKSIAARHQTTAAGSTLRAGFRHGLAGFLLAAGVCASSQALAGIGLAVVLDLPSEVAAGDSNLNGSITIVNMNTDQDRASQNLVFDIAVTPSCSGSSPSATRSRR